MNPYLGHTEDERQEILRAIGLNSIDELFESVPAEIQFPGDLGIPQGLDESQLLWKAGELSSANLPGVGPKAFLGAGIYEHMIPSVVNHLVSRGEFLTAYTPYQPEASQGVLQAFFEFQTMVCNLTNMPIANASLYDGSTALAEACLAALGTAKNKSRIVLSAGVHPQYRQTLESYLANLPYEIEVAPMRDGRVDLDALNLENVAGVAVQHPNYFGLLEDMPAISEAVHAAGSDLIAVVEPVSLAVLAPPGDYKADIAIGEGQPLGLHTYMGGDTVGLFACTEKYMRRIPGRLVGEAVDRNGKTGYVLTLQTREQHIRREKATSNICTNQGLNALKAAIFISALGPQGLREMAGAWCKNTHYLVERLRETCGARPAFEGAYFGECVVRLGVDARALPAKLLEQGFVAGVPVDDVLPDMTDARLLCATETKATEHINRLVDAIGTAIHS